MGSLTNLRNPDSPAVLLSSRLKESNPETNFLHCYRLARLFGLSPDQKTFLFKMIQNLLTTRERLHRSGKAPSPCCTHCDAQQDTPEHLLSCPQSSEVAAPLLACLASQSENLTPKDITILNIHSSESWKLPAVWMSVRQSC